MNLNDSLRKKVNLYFNYFSNKNLNLITNLFAENIRLRDWEIDELGILNVTNAIKNIFQNVDTIEIMPLDVQIYKFKAYCEINIVINSTEYLKVVDIIDFEENGLITSIKAFKG